MEDWDYFEGLADLYDDFMMEVPQPLTSPDLSGNRTSPGTCPHPLLPQDCNQEDPDVPQDQQNEDLTHINTIETYLRGDERSNEEIPTYDYTDDHTRRPEGQLTSSVFKCNDDLIITQDTMEVEDIFPDIPSSFQNKDLIFDSLKQQLSSDSSQTIGANKNQNDLTAKTTFSTSENGKISSLIESQIHREEERFSCSECGKYFTDKTNFVKQKRFYTLEKPYLCPECGKCFSNQSNPSTLQRTHTGEKLYSCSDCGKYFRDKSNLVKHQRIHTGEKPYSCSDCGKCFNRKASLVRHQRIYTGEKPYSCSDCGKCFNRKANLDMHQRIHTGEKPYSCSVCGKCFNRKSNRDIHQRIHEEEKPCSNCSCSDCGK